MNSFSAQSSFHSPSCTKFNSSLRTTEQNKSLLLVNHSHGYLILLAQENYSQVVWFQSTNIFQPLYFNFVLIFMERKTWTTMEQLNGIPQDPVFI